MDPADIIAHAASLTEADLAAILAAKCPNAINGYPVQSICVTWHNGKPSSVEMCANDEWVFKPTIDEAVQRMKEKLGTTPQEKAAIIRAHAAKMLAEANALDPQ